MSDEDARVLQIVFDGQAGHRSAQLKALAKKCRDAANVLQSIGADAGHAEATQERYNDTLLGEAEALIREARKALEAVRQADVTIGNIENLSRGRMKFFGQSATVSKAPNNVTNLPISRPTQAKGSSSNSGKISGTENPGTKRQRQRKQSQNDK